MASVQLLSIISLLSILAHAQMPGPGPDAGTSAANGTVLDNLNNHPRLRMLSLVLRTYCGQVIREQLNNRTANLTFFAPSDLAIARAFDLSGIKSADDFNCPNIPGGNLTALSADCQPAALLQGAGPEDKRRGSGVDAGIPFRQASPCIPLLLQYHLVPDQRLDLSNSSSSANFTNVTTLRTALNDTRFVQLANLNQTSNNTSNSAITAVNNNTSTSFQALLLNQTTNGTASLYHGAWQPARILTNETISGINGIVYFIDSVLLPPANLTASLRLRPETSRFLGALNRTLSTETNNSTTNASNQTIYSVAGTPLRNLTIFAPIDSAFNSTAVGGSNNNTSQVNMTSYIIPNHVHLFTTGNSTEGNRTSTGSFSMDMRNIVGQSVMAEWDSSGNATVNGVQVVEPNILISEGVLHLINGTISANQTSNTNNTVSAQAAWFFRKHRKC